MDPKQNKKSNLEGALQFAASEVGQTVDVGYVKNTNRV